MDNVLQALENLNLFLAGCSHVLEEGPIQKTFNAVRGDVITIRDKLKEIKCDYHYEESETEIEADGSNN